MLSLFDQRSSFTLSLSTDALRLVVDVEFEYDQIRIESDVMSL